ncbi:hypothetical protein [Brevundimonas halotolerans]|uniref:hypothetical protein n=1 Tax=Brevundimonas halotolerans TaxID=69670 RepID=UPI0016063C70|nr:hypothetical protein [Brevundimonas halotolerans]
MQLKEMQTFVDGLKAVDADELGFVVAQAASWRNELEDQGYDLMDPLVFHALNPTAVSSLVKVVHGLQKQGIPQVASGLMVWVHTLRAGNSLRLRAKAREMWTELSRGFPHAVNARSALNEAAGAWLDIEGYDEIPIGLNPKAL